MPITRVEAVQDTFLDQLSKQSAPVTVFLANGVKLQGIVTHHDKFGIALVRDGWTQYVFKHAISAINPNLPFELSGELEEAAEG